MRLFTRNGYDATTVDMIASASGIHKASVYYHFTGKEEILKVTLDTVLEPLEALMEEVNRKDASSYEKIELLVEGTVTLIRELRGQLLLLSTVKSDTLTEVAARRRRREFQRFVGELFKGAIADGTIASHFDPELLGKLLFGMANSTVYWWRTDRSELSVEQLAATIIEIFTHGAAKSDQPKPRLTADP